MAPSRVGFAAVTRRSLAATVAESLLAPAYPLIGDALGLGAGFAGIAFGVLARGDRDGGVVGGFVLGRLGASVPAKLFSGSVPRALSAALRRGAGRRCRAERAGDRPRRRCRPEA